MDQVSKFRGGRSRKGRKVKNFYKEVSSPFLGRSGFGTSRTKLGGGIPFQNLGVALRRGRVGGPKEQFLSDSGAASRGSRKQKEGGAKYPYTAQQERVGKRLKAAAVGCTAAYLKLAEISGGGDSRSLL